MSVVNAFQVWEVDERLVESPSVTNRNLFAQKLKDEDPDTILRRWHNFGLQAIDDFYGNVFDLLPEVRLSGVGLELGAGTGGFSSVICKRFADIRSIYAVEVVADVVRLLQPKTMAGICGERVGKIERVIGSFDALELDAASVDFCVEIDSLHHSDDLGATLKEVARVMKHGGVLVILDRSHNNKLSEEQTKFMLDVVYSEEWKKEHGFDLARLTRRENGEHELRLGDWEDALREAGFVVDKRLELRAVTLQKLLRGLMLSLPFRLRKRLKLLPSRVRPQEGELLWMLAYLMGKGRASRLYQPFLRDYTLFIARR